MDELLLDEALGEIGDLLNATIDLRYTLPQTLHARAGQEETVAYVGGWYRHAEYLLDAVGLLMSNGLEHAAPPLLRQMLEDAVSAALVSQDPNTWLAVLVAARESLTKASKARLAISASIPPEMTDYVNSLPEDEGDGYRKFRRMTERFNGLGIDGQQLRVAWDTLTHASHGNDLSAALFLDFDGGPGGIPSVRQEAQVPPSRLVSWLVALDALMLCVDALSACLQDDPLRQELLDIHAEKRELEHKIGIPDD